MRYTIGAPIQLGFENERELDEFIEMFQAMKQRAVNGEKVFPVQFTFNMDLNPNEKKEYLNSTENNQIPGAEGAR